MSCGMKLTAGSRFALTGEGQFYLLEKGRTEVYAVQGEERDYRQVFLLERREGKVVFPSFDDSGVAQLFVLALTDVEMAEHSWADLPADELRSLAQEWFASLEEMPWLKKLASADSVDIALWAEEADGSIWQDCLDDDLEGVFSANQDILSHLIALYFRTEDKEWQQRLELRQTNKGKLLDEGIEFLLGEQHIHYEEGMGQETLSQAAFIVQQAAAALDLPTENIKIAPELVRRMAPDKILRRLVQKANMQLRQVHLEGDWHRKDSNVLIGYYGEEAEPVVLKPSSPSSYLMIDVEHPDGVPVTDEVEKDLRRVAYVCYAGLPRRALKVKDLMLFMFHQCWKKDYLTIIGASLLGSLMPLLTPIVTETIFSDIIPIQDRLGLATVTQMLMVSAFTVAAVGIVRSIAVLRITTHLDMTTEAALWNRLLSLPTKFFRRFTVGELASRMDGINSVKQVVNGEFVATIFNTLFSFWSLVMMCWYSVKLAGIAVVVWLVYCLITVFIYRRVLNFQRKEIAAGNEYAGVIQQIFNGLAKFRIQGAEEQAYHLWGRYFGETWKWNLKLRWQSNYNMIIGSIEPFILNLALYYVALYGITTVNPDGTQVVGISYPEFLAFTSAYSTFNGALHAIIPLVGTFFSIQPHIENLRPILNELPEVDEDKVDADILTGALEVNHLSFSYKKDGPEIFKIGKIFMMGDGEMKGTKYVAALLLAGALTWGMHGAALAAGANETGDAGLLAQAAVLEDGDAEAYYNRACNYANLGQYDKAIDDFTQAIALDGKAAAYARRCMCYNALGQYDKAMADCNQALALDGGQAYAYYARGSTYLCLKQYDKAIGDLTQSIDLDATNAYAYNNRGLSYKNLAQYDRAIEDFTQSIALNDKIAIVYYNRGVALGVLGQYDKALDDLTQSIALDGTDANAYFNRGAAYRALGQPDKAVSDYTQAIALDGSFAWAHYGRGIAYASIAQYEKAVVDFTQAVTLNAEDEDAYYNRGVCYLHLDQLDKAMDDFMQTISLDGGYAEAYVGRGDVYRITGRYDKALADYQRALTLEDDAAFQERIRAIIQKTQQLMQQ